MSLLSSNLEGGGGVDCWIDPINCAIGIKLKQITVVRALPFTFIY